MQGQCLRSCSLWFSLPAGTALSTEGLDTPHVLKCGYTHSCDLINCFPLELCSEASGCEESTASSHCLFLTGGVNPLPRDPERGKGQKSPVSLLSSDLEASKKKVLESLSYLLLEIY